jgi:hypothetical protein
MKFVSYFFDFKPNLYKFLNLQGFEYYSEKKKKNKDHRADSCSRPSGVARLHRTGACGPWPRGPATLGMHAAHSTSACARHGGTLRGSGGMALWSTVLQFIGEQCMGRRRNGITGERRRQQGDGEPHRCACSVERVVRR